jgi:hypothetical protein
MRRDRETASRATADEDGYYCFAVALMMPQPTMRFNRQICDVLRYCTSPHARTISSPVPPVAPKQEPSCSISIFMV